ncbi:MAG: thiamine-phosphate kinase [Bacteroidales bacterium]|jgi:thiamine-monophosphate kinase|nr:thiamine-phosphate kinase [Bacteroidales bacterium]
MKENEKKLTEIAELGEFGLIDRLTKDIKIKHKNTLKGVGDDAAVIDYGNICSVVTTDLLIEGIHFNLMYTPLKHLGYKAVVVNLSDVYAMNATPKQITVSLAISKKFATEHIEEIYEGIQLACETYDVDLVGGDTSSSLTGLAISITAIGEVKKEEITYRSTAQNTDIICVSGNLGAAYMGLQLLEREKEIFNANPGTQPQLEGYDYILQRQLKPEARKDVVALFKKQGIKPTSMIDISDGLSSELLHICKNSGVGCKIFQDKIPIDLNTERMTQEFKMEPLIAALNGGEDYELLFTVNISDFEKIKDQPLIHPIGHITDKKQGAMLLTESGQAIPLQAQGWNPLKEDK